MATEGGSPSAGVTDRFLCRELGEDDLKVVHLALYPIAAKYLMFGIQIDVKMSEIEKIQRKCNDSNECLLHVLSVRLKQPQPLTWNDIDTALRSVSVGEHGLANRVKKEYGHLYRSDSGTHAATPDQQHGAKEIKKIEKHTSGDRFHVEFSNEQGECVKEEVSEAVKHTTQVPCGIDRESVAKQQSNNVSPKMQSDQVKMETKSIESQEHKIFERFFGQLCCDITDPVETAAQLQKESLISKAVMKGILMSHESQQAKTISLVDAVDEAIKSEPDLLFVFIKVLLKDESLQKVGGEMLRETGS